MYVSVKYMKHKTFKTKSTEGGSTGMLLEGRNQNTCRFISGV